MRKIVVCSDISELYETAAEFLIDHSLAAVTSGGRSVMALPGGNTPRGLFHLLARAPYQSLLPWTQVHFFWGDERYVPKDSPQSNYRLAHEAFFVPLAIPGENIHRIRVEYGSPEQAAADYQQRIREFFQLDAGEFPRFDLILLGMGADGHTASLFPGGSELNVHQDLVTWSQPKSSAVPRITLTLDTINQARHIAFLLSGEEKAATLRRVLDGDENLPAALVKPENGTLTYFVDKAAGRFQPEFQSWNTFLTRPGK